MNLYVLYVRGPHQNSIVAVFDSETLARQYAADNYKRLGPMTMIYCENRGWRPVLEIDLANPNVPGSVVPVNPPNEKSSGTL